jgi:hypothetical protein
MAQGEWKYRTWKVINSNGDVFVDGGGCLWVV